MEQSEYPKDSKDLPFVVIVSVNWNGWRDTLECLESVRRLDYPNYLMIVVDNASRDDSLARIREWAEKKEGYLLVEYPETVARAGGEVVQEQALTAALPASRAVLIRSAVNAAITGGGNLAIDYALRRDQPVDYVFMLENDAKAEKRTLSHLVEVARKENAGIVGGVILDWKTGQIQYAERTTLLRWFFRPLVNYDLPLPAKEVDYWPSAGVSGPSMLIRRDVLDTLYASIGHHIPSDLFRGGMIRSIVVTRTRRGVTVSLIFANGWREYRELPSVTCGSTRSSSSPSLDQAAAGICTPRRRSSRRAIPSKYSERGSTKMS
jgi:cellulose synthase/poly-beta-1,6-N-acetylglucosamine synthase-like glycosyltransferase